MRNVQYPIRLFCVLVTVLLTIGTLASANVDSGYLLLR